MSIESPTFLIELTGKEHALRFDLDAQIGVTTTLKILNPGYQNITWWRFLDPPYDIVDMVALIMHGINGAKRFNGEKNFLKIEDAKDLLEKHYEYLQEKAEDIEDDDDAMKFIQDENAKLFDALAAAARGGSGFRRSRKKAASLSPSSEP